jgi:hypothetical protein
MAELSTAALTLGEHAKRLDPDGKTAQVVELLSQTNEIIDDMLWREGNQPMGDQATVRTGLPDVYFRLTNQGTPSSTSKTAQITEQCALLNGRSSVDKVVAEMNGNVNMLRADEGAAFMESLNQKFADTLFYGSSANPEEIVGLANRYSDLGAQNGENIIDAGGTGSDNSSVWLIGWGQRTVHGIFPRASKAGVGHENMGLQDEFDSSNNRYRAYMDEWDWKFGLQVRDWRYAVRIANIDISTLIADPDGTTTNLLNLMLDAVHHLPTTSGSSSDRGVVGVTPVFYANRTLAKMLDTQAMNKSNLHLSVGNEEGDQKVRFRGIPIKTVDALTEAEARVT